MNMRTKEELIREIEDRNKARTEAGLPLVSVSEEVAKISEAERYRDYCDWYNASPHLKRIREEVLAEERRFRHDPNWVPRGHLSGGGAGYAARVSEKMHQIWEEERKRKKCPSP
jgi:hypothetical protein